MRVSRAVRGAFAPILVKKVAEDGRLGGRLYVDSHAAVRIGPVGVFCIVVRYPVVDDVGLGSSRNADADARLGGVLRNLIITEIMNLIVVNGCMGGGSVEVDPDAAQPSTVKNVADDLEVALQVGFLQG